MSNLYEKCSVCLRQLDANTVCKYTVICEPDSKAELFLPISFTPEKQEEVEAAPSGVVLAPISSGSTAHYYEIPIGTYQLQDLISYLNCNAQLGEIGRAWMRYGKCGHSSKKRDLEKIIFYAQAELARLEKYGE